jgi:cyclohexadieny/prephenate dehydrogenase
MAVIYDRVALIGLGLIAGSMAHAMRRGGLAARSWAPRARPRRGTRARDRLCDRIVDTAAEAVDGRGPRGACVPVGAMGAVAAEIAPHLRRGDGDGCGLGQARRHRGGRPAPARGVHFVPGHPLAGTEHSGPTSGFAELFDNRYVLLTPVEGSDAAAVERLRRLWEAAARMSRRWTPITMTWCCAVTSHTPHLIAYTMVGVADDLRRVTDSEVIKYSAAGFRDFTRIAASDPTMWRDVFLTNKDATLEILGRFTEELFALQRAIRTGRR